MFGSAVRTDFRPDSDVDVALVPGDRSLSFFDLLDLERELEQRLGRDVDLCLLPNAIDEVARAVAREGVVAQLLDDTIRRLEDCLRELG